MPATGGRCRENCLSEVIRISIPRNALVVLCGPAASGKSAFARAHFKETQVVSSDRCRALVSDDEENIAVSSHAFELFYFIIAKRLLLGRLAVADSTALSAEVRRRLRKIARDLDAPAHLIAFHVPFEQLVERDRARERTVGEQVLRAQVEKFANAMANVPNEVYDAVWRLDERPQRDVCVELVDPVRPSDA